MLVLTRKLGEKVFLTTDEGDRIEVVLISVRGKQVRLGFICGPTVQINRDVEFANKAVSGKETASG